MGYPAPALENLHGSTQSYIHSLEPLRNPLQNKLSIEKQEMQDQAWRMISLIKPEFYEYKLNDIFLSAIQSLPIVKGDASQIFTCLQENPGIDLGQIYMQRCMGQFWDWIGIEVALFPPESFRIWLNFHDFTPSNINKWEELLALQGWSDSQKEEIKSFQLKHKFINGNHSCLPYIRLEGSILDGKAFSYIKSQKELQKQHITQYRLLLKFAEHFFQKIFKIGRQSLEEQGEMLETMNMLQAEASCQWVSPLVQEMLSSVKKKQCAFALGSWEYRFSKNLKKISYKIFIWRVKKVLPIIQSSLEQAINEWQNTNQILMPLREMQKSSLERILNRRLEGGLQLLPFIKEKLERFNEPFDLRNMQLNDFKKDIFSFKLLSQALLSSLVKQQDIKQQSKEPTEAQKALIEKNQKELIEGEERISSSQEKLPAFPVSSDRDSEAEELVLSDNQPTNTALLNEPVYFFAEIDTFLKNPHQVDGFLSKAINRVLKQLKMHLLKIQTDHPGELKILQSKKIYEIHAQLTLATAAQEQIMQAIQDQRWEHVVLGFRSTFIHCHFAVEQMLSLEILCKSGRITTTHNLGQLEKEAKIHINEFGQKNEFLRDIAMYLWFCYPGDYRSFYIKSDYPRPFIFLEQLFHPHKDASGENLNTELLTEATQMCFRMYSQTIEFIVEASSFPMEDPHEFLEKMKEAYQKIQIKIHNNKNSNKLSIQSSILQKCKGILHIFENINIPEFEEKHFLQRPLDTIKEYLQLMELALQSPPESHTHSLQKFLQIEVLANMDKLFKHLFRTIILLQTGEDNHSHNLLKLFQLVEDFYKRDILTDQDKAILEKINLNITHHYLHKDSHALLQRKYKDFFDQAYKLAIYSEGDSVRFGKRTISYRDLDQQKEMIYAELELALDLFNKLFNPLVSEFEELNVCDLKRTEAF